MHIIQTNTFLIVTNFYACERARRPALQPALRPVLRHVLRHVLGLELDRVFADFDRCDAPAFGLELERDLDTIGASSDPWSKA